MLRVNLQINSTFNLQNILLPARKMRCAHDVLGTVVGQVFMNMT